MQDNKKNIADYNLAAILAEIRTEVKHLSSQMSEVISDFKEVHKDHEKRLRDLEKNNADMSDVNKVHLRVDKIQKNLWKTWLVMACSGGVTGAAASVLTRLFIGQ